MKRWSARAGRRGSRSSGIADARGLARRGEDPDRPTREPNGTFWFGAELDPDGDQVWFRITEESIDRMPEKTLRARGARLVDALIVWITPDRQFKPGLSGYEVRVSEAGDTWSEPLRW